MNPHATPQDTLAALRTRYTGELAVADAASQGEWSVVEREADPLVIQINGHPHHCWQIVSPEGANKWLSGTGVAVTICPFEDADVPTLAQVAHNADFIAAARESVPRDARLKLALLDRIEVRLIKLECVEMVTQTAMQQTSASIARAAMRDLTRHEDALATLRLLAESAGEAVAW